MRFDRFDRAATSTVAPEVWGLAKDGLHETAGSLAAEGARGRACRELLAKEIAACRVRLRYFEGLFNVEMVRITKGKGSDRVLRMAERQIDKTHRRLITSINTLARLEQPTSSLRITAHQAAVIVGPERAGGGHQ